MITEFAWQVRNRRLSTLWVGSTVAVFVAIGAVAVPQAHAQAHAQLPNGDSSDSSHVATDVAHPRATLPERPTVATHAYTVAPGYVEIETGGQEMRPMGTSQFVAPMVVKLGIAPRLQLEIQDGYVHSTAAGASAAGASDAAIALKQRMWDAVPIVQDISLQLSVKFATGAHDIGTGTTDLSVLLISSRQIGTAELDLNAGYTRRSGDGVAAPLNATLLTASLATPIVGNLGGVAELFSYPGTSGPTGTPPAVGFLAGPTLQLRPWLVLDAGVILNVQHMQANAVYTGVTYNIGRIPGFSTPRR